MFLFVKTFMFDQTESLDLFHPLARSESSFWPSSHSNESEVCGGTPGIQLRSLHPAK